MIGFADVTFTYTDAAAPTLRHVDLTIDEGELCLVVGQTGSGKTTLLRAINGLVPHFTGGHLAGDVSIDGRSTRDHPPRELADVVGVVGQNPAASFVTDIVEDELAYTMENLGVAPDAMRRRVEDTLDLLGTARTSESAPAHAVGRPTAAGGHRGGAHVPRPGSWCSTSPRRHSTPPPPKRCWPP